MSAGSIQRGLTLPTATLTSAAQRLLGALQDETIGAPVVSQLSPAFVADFSAQVALVARLGTDQSGAIGSVGILVQSQAEVRAELARLALVARRAARLAFPDQTTLLRGEFQIGASRVRDLPTVLERGRKLLAACQRSASELTAQGWLPVNTAALARALERLASLSEQREQEADGKIGVTAERVAAGHRLYRQCRTVQNVADLVYADLRGSADPASVECRARFLLGEFPRRRGSAAAVAVAQAPLAVAA